MIPFLKFKLVVNAADDKKIHQERPGFHVLFFLKIIYSFLKFNSIYGQVSFDRPSYIGKQSRCVEFQPIFRTAQLITQFFLVLKRFPHEVSSFGDDQLRLKTGMRGWRVPNVFNYEDYRKVRSIAVKSEITDLSGLNGDPRTFGQFEFLLCNSGLCRSGNRLLVSFGDVLIKVAQTIERNGDTDARDDYQCGLSPKIKISFATCLFALSCWGIWWSLSQFYDEPHAVGAGILLLFSWLGVIGGSLLALPFIAH